MAFQNFFATKLYTDIGASDTSIALEIVPTATSGYLTLEARNPTQREIIRYTGISGNTITGVTRGQGNTTAKSHLKGALTEMNAVGENFQELYDAFASFTATNLDGWVNTLQTPTTITQHGQRSTAIRFTGQNLTDRIQKGTKLKVPRSVVPATKAADIETSSVQYASRATASVAGHSFTDDFTVEAWINPESYGVQGTIAARRQGSPLNGWQFGLRAAGEVFIQGFNNGNGRAFITIVSVPLNKWTHVAVTADMSGIFSNIYIDGIRVHNYHTAINAGSSSIAQGSGDLTIGAYTGGNEVFDGKIADVRVWSHVRTEAQIRDNMFNYPSNTTGLVGHWKLNNDWNDSTANANHLTAVNGASFATDNPWNATEYAIVNEVAYTGGNTDVTVFTGAKGGIPSEALGSVSYSTHRAPYGFPVSRDNWKVETILRVSESMAYSGVGAWGQHPASNCFLAIPIGEWTYGFDASIWSNSSVSGGRNTYYALSSSAPPHSPAPNVPQGRLFAPTGTDALGSIYSKRDGLVVPTQTSFRIYGFLVAATGAEVWRINGNEVECRIFAESPYL